MGWRRLLCIAGAAALLWPFEAGAQSVSQWPDHPVRLLVTVGAGGAADTLSRNLSNGFAQFANGQPLIVENRPLRAVRCADEVVWFDFDTLCRTARSQNDYLDIASRFDTVMLSDVPQMDSRMASEARRFTWLIDVLYDQKVNLVISAEVPPDQLYTSGAMAHEFVRTASRLHEMQSDTYRNEARRAQADRLG